MSPSVSNVEKVAKKIAENPSLKKSEFLKQKKLRAKVVSQSLNAQ